MTVPQWLKDLGIPEECISRQSSARERGQTFSIKPLPGDDIWCVKMDGCWITDNQTRRIDYLFWGQSASGRKVILLVELKGKKFHDALEQIEQTLQRLCKNAVGQGIHRGAHITAPGHDPDGVKAYVVLGQAGHFQRQNPARQRILDRYHVTVYPHRQQTQGLDQLLKQKA